MLDLQLLPEGNQLSRLHASTCLSMTRFITGHHCPKLAQQIVHQINLLLAHPESSHACGSRETYRLLLEHWQKITSQLLAQHGAQKQSVIIH